MPTARYLTLSGISPFAACLKLRLVKALALSVPNFFLVQRRLQPGQGLHIKGM